MSYKLVAIYSIISSIAAIIILHILGTIFLIAIAGLLAATLILSFKISK